MLNLLKNAIVIGIILFVGIYGYLYWSNKKKYEKDSSVEKQSVNIMIPGIVGIIGWFIASSLLGSSKLVPSIASNIPTIKKMQMQQNVQPIMYQNGAADIPTGSVEFHLLENKVKVPPEDVLIELAPSF